jgi:hypothetical protein
MDAIHFISVTLNDELDRLAAKEITLEQFNYLVDVYENRSFASGHAKFFPAMRNLAVKIANEKFDD